MATQISGDTGVSQCQPGSVSQDDLQSGVVGKGPAFSAYPSASQVVNGETLLQMNTEEFDTDNCYNPSTYRFTPNVAGYYQINGAFQLSSSTTVYCRLRKNGVLNKIGNIIPAGTMPTISVLVYMNGTTDYLELLGYAAVSGNTLSGSTSGYFQGALVRAA